MVSSVHKKSGMEESDFTVDTAHVPSFLLNDQENIYKFFLNLVHQNSSNTVLEEFANLFFELHCSFNPDINEALTHLLKEEQYETLFRQTLKRCCYILINNWLINRNYKSTRALVQCLNEQHNNETIPISTPLIRLQTWLKNFLNSSDYHEIRHFACPEGSDWSSRYQTYLLIPQYLNPRNSQEQKEAARTLAKQLKDKYKFDLAMYVVRSESSTRIGKPPNNPTKLGDEVIQLIKLTISTQSVLSYANQANLFLQTTKNLPYEDFKKNLPQYLMINVGNQYPATLLREKMIERLESLYPQHNHQIVDKSIILRTCNRLIDFLMGENGKEPSFIFRLMAQSHQLTLVIILLKTIILCSSSRTHLDICIANLIQFYQNYDEQRCQDFINFLEVFNLVFTLFTENVQYHLVKIDNNTSFTPDQDLEAYRLFCQFKGPDLRSTNLKGVNLKGLELRGADLRQSDLTGVDLTGVDLSLATLSQANLSQAILDHSKLFIANLKGVDLSEASLIGVDIRRAELSNAVLIHANLNQAKCRRTDLQYANLTDAQLIETQLDHADLRNAILCNCTLQNANLQHANLTGANLRLVNLKGANLQGANLSQVDLRGANLTGANLQGAILEQANLSGAILDNTDLSKASCNRTNFTKAHLHNAVLKQVNFREANLTSAILRSGNLNGANLSHANLTQVDLTRADLANTNLSYTNLMFAQLRHTRLKDAYFFLTDLRGANLFGSNLRDAKVQGVKLGDNSGVSQAVLEYISQNQGDTLIQDWID